MTNETSKPNRPSHRIYNLTKCEDGKTNWGEIGAAWPHKDGKGFTLKFSTLPAAGADIALRVATAKKGGAQ